MTNGLLKTDIPLVTAVLLLPQGKPVVFVLESSQYSSVLFCTVNIFFIMDVYIYIIRCNE